MPSLSFPLSGKIETDEDELDIEYIIIDKYVKEVVIEFNTDDETIEPKDDEVVIEFNTDDETIEQKDDEVVIDDEDDSDVEVTPEPVVEEVTPEPVVEEVTPEPVVEEVTPEPVVEEVTPEPVVEEITEPVVEEVTPEPVVEEVTPKPVLEEITEPVEEKTFIEEVTPEPVVEEVTPEPVVEEITEPVEDKTFIEEVTPEPVVEEVTPEPVVEEVTPEPVVEEITEPVEEKTFIEEVTPEPVVEEVTPKPVLEEITEPVEEKTFIEEVTPEPVVEEITEPVVEEITEPVEDKTFIEEETPEPVDVVKKPINDIINNKLSKNLYYFPTNLSSKYINSFPVNLFNILNHDFICKPLSNNEKILTPSCFVSDILFVYYNLDSKTDFLQYNLKLKKISKKLFKKKFIYIPSISNCRKLLSIYNNDFNKLKKEFLSYFHLVFSLYFDSINNSKLIWVPTISRNKYKYINKIECVKNRFIANHPEIKNKEGIKFVNHFSNKYHIDVYGRYFEKNKQWKKFKTEYKTLDDFGAKERIDILSRYKFIIVFEDFKINGFLSDYLLDVIAAGSIPIYGGNNYSFFYKFPGIIEIKKFSDFDNLHSYLKNISNILYEKMILKNFSLLLEYMKKTSEENIFHSIKKNIMLLKI